MACVEDRALSGVIDFGCGNWHQTVRWLRENPDHPDRQQRIEALHRDQDAYPFRLRYQGWAIYVLSRV